jgi:hypothetical protein
MKPITSEAEVDAPLEKGVIGINGVTVPTLFFELTCITVRSYGMEEKQLGEVILTGIETLDLQEKEVIKLDMLRPKSISGLVLLYKKHKPLAPCSPDRLCFDIDYLFVVGSDLDYKEQHRRLRGSHAIES